MLKEKIKNQFNWEINSEYIKDLLNGYINSDLTTFNSHNGFSLFDLFRIDNENISKVNMDDSKAFYKALLELAHYYQISSKDILVEAKKFPGKINFDTILPPSISRSDDLKRNRIMLSVPGEALFKALFEIYHMGAFNKYDFNVEIPASDKQELGLKDSISIYVSDVNLIATLARLDKLGDKIFSNIGTSINYLPSSREGLSYDVYLPEYSKWLSTIIGETLISSIDKTIYEWVSNVKDKEYSLETITELYQRNYQTDLHRKNIIHYMDVHGYNPIDTIINLTVSELEKFNLVTPNVVEDIKESEEHVIEVPEAIIEYQQLEETQEVKVEEISAPGNEIVKADELVESTIELPISEEEKNAQDQTGEEKLQELMASRTINLVPGETEEDRLNALLQSATDDVSSVNYSKEEVNLDITPLEKVQEINVDNALFLQEQRNLQAGWSDDIIDPSEVLSQEEINSLDEVIYDANNTIDISKYAYISDSLSFFLIELEENKTVFEFLEENNVAEVIPANAIVVSEEGTYTAGEFIKNDLVKYVISNGNISLNDYIEMMKINIKIPKEKKNNFFGKFFGGQ